MSSNNKKRKKRKKKLRQMLATIFSLSFYTFPQAVSSPLVIYFSLSLFCLNHLGVLGRTSSAGGGSVAPLGANKVSCESKDADSDGSDDVEVNIAALLIIDGGIFVARSELRVPENLPAVLRGGEGEGDLLELFVAVVGLLLDGALDLNGLASSVPICVFEERVSYKNDNRASLRDATRRLPTAKRAIRRFRVVAPAGDRTACSLVTCRRSWHP